jgi:hypothetical protein
MPYTAPHWLITVFGDAWQQTETWQFGVRARIEGVATPADQQTLANSLAAATTSFFGSSSLMISQYVRMLGIKAALIDFDGTYVSDGPPGMYLYPTPIVGPGSTYVPVPQATIAVTLLTEVSRGRASKGRFYLPPAVRSLGIDGRLAIADADAIETSARTWLGAINGTAQVSNVAVMSKLGDGTTHDVTAVGVGRVVDTMRSRRRSLLEGRTPLAL